MIFLFPRWDMWIPWRVYTFTDMRIICMLACCTFCRFDFFSDRLDSLEVSFCHCEVVVWSGNKPRMLGKRWGWHVLHSTVTQKKRIHPWFQHSHSSNFSTPKSVHFFFKCRWIMQFSSSLAWQHRLHWIPWIRLEDYVGWRRIFSPLKATQVH